MVQSQQPRFAMVKRFVAVAVTHEQLVNLRQQQLVLVQPCLNALAIAFEPLFGFSGLRRIAGLR